MGGNSTKFSTHNQTQLGTTFPELPPYSGLPVEYKHVAVNAELDTQSHFSFMEQNMTIQATNEEQYHRQLATLYDEGYKLLAFVSQPGSIKNYDLPSAGYNEINIRFDGIFRKCFHDQKKLSELQVVKSTVSNQMFQMWSGDILLNAGSETDSLTSGALIKSGGKKGITKENYHIFQTLSTIAQEGGRLISVELTGMSREQIEIQKQYLERQSKKHHITTDSLPSMQVAVDVFFEISRQTSNERYAYKIASCPIVSKYHHSFPRGHFTSTIDWQSVTSQYLGKGWKLVEIVEDYSVTNLTHINAVRVNSDLVKNCLWIFEKPLSRLDENRPLYEITILDHWIKLHSHGHNLGQGGAEINITIDLESVLQHYGQNGWEVLKILETPDTKCEGTFQPTAFTRVVIFFQRLTENDTRLVSEQTKI